VSPSSLYAAAKAGGDMIALAYARTHGLNVSITRCCNNYGPYQHPEKVIPLLVSNLLDGQQVPLYGDGSSIRTWVRVDDHCRGIQLAAERGPRTLNGPGSPSLGPPAIPRGSCLPVGERPDERLLAVLAGGRADGGDRAAGRAGQRGDLAGAAAGQAAGRRGRPGHPVR